MKAVIILSLLLVACSPHGRPVSLPFVRSVKAMPLPPPSAVVRALAASIQEHPEAWHQSSDNTDDDNLYLYEPSGLGVAASVNGLCSDCETPCSYASVEETVVIDCFTKQGEADSKFLAPYYEAWVRANPRDMATVARRQKMREQREERERLAEISADTPKDPVEIIRRASRP